MAIRVGGSSLTSPGWNLSFIFLDVLLSSAFRRSDRPPLPTTRYHNFQVQHVLRFNQIQIKDHEGPWSVLAAQRLLSGEFPFARVVVQAIPVPDNKKRVSMMLNRSLIMIEAGSDNDEVAAAQGEGEEQETYQRLILGK